MKLVEFIYSDFYQNYLDELDKFLPEKEKIDRKSKLNNIVVSLHIKWLDFAGMNIEDLRWLIDNYKSNTINYMVSKLICYREPDGGKDPIVNLSPQINFPIGHLIEFFIMLKKPERLVDYIDDIRMPFVKKYAEEITKMFNEFI